MDQPESFYGEYPRYVYSSNEAEYATDRIAQKKRYEVLGYAFHGYIEYTLNKREINTVHMNAKRYLKGEPKAVGSKIQKHHSGSEHQHAGYQHTRRSGSI